MNPVSGWLAGLLGVILGGVVALVGWCETHPMPENPQTIETPAPDPPLDEFYSGP